MSEMTRLERMPCPNCINNNGARCSIGLDVMPDLNNKGVCRGFLDIAEQEDINDVAIKFLKSKCKPEYHKYIETDLAKDFACHIMRIFR